MKLTLNSKIGTGGFSTVYSGVYNSENVAIKKIANFGVSYLMELSIMSSIKKRELNSSIDIISSGDSIYIIQPLAISDLRKYMITNFISIRNKKAGIRSIVKGMRYLHSINIIHCDIKPSNILLFPTVSTIIKWKLTDFGISKLVGSESKISCTSIYRPKEAWSSTKVNESIDYWSLGCTIFYILEEKLLFRSQKIIENRAPVVSKINMASRYLLAINHFNNQFYGAPEPSRNILYNIPNTKAISEYNDFGLLDMLDPDPKKRSIDRLVKYLGLSKEKSRKKELKTSDYFSKTIKRYEEKVNKVNPSTIKIIKWMVDKLSDSTLSKPDNIPLYSALSIEHNVFKTLDYNIL